MNAIYKLVTASALSLVIASPVLADRQSYCDHDREDRIEHRINRQYQRIQHAIDRHSLTHKESKHLKKKHRKISRLSREYREDGYLSRIEFKRLTRKLDRLSDRIWEYKHNDLERYVIYHDKYAHKDRGNKY